MEKAEAKKILCEQLVLLAERSKMLDGYDDTFDLVMISIAMCILSQYISAEGLHTPIKAIMDAYPDILGSR